MMKHIELSHAIQLLERILRNETGERIDISRVLLEFVTVELGGLVPKKVKPKRIYTARIYKTSGKLTKSNVSEERPLMKNFMFIKNQVIRQRVFNKMYARWRRVHGPLSISPTKERGTEQ